MHTKVFTQSIGSVSRRGNAMGWGLPVSVCLGTGTDPTHRSGLHYAAVFCGTAEWQLGWLIDRISENKNPKSESLRVFCFLGP